MLFFAGEGLMIMGPTSDFPGTFLTFPVICQVAILCTTQRSFPLQTDAARTRKA